MFVARLLAALKTPHTHLGMLDDTLVLDVDRYRGALLRLLRWLSDAGAISDATATWTFACIADGWIDEHLANVRDGLLELGAVAEQAHLERLLLAATHHILGCGPGTAAYALAVTAQVAGAQPILSSDALLLHAVTQAAQAAESDHEPLGLRLLVRRYALELGLLGRVVMNPAAATAESTLTVVRTPLGDAVLALPQPCVLTFLLALEILQSAGPADRWRTPQSALGHMQAQAQFLVATTAQARRTVDPAGLFPWRRIRRLHLLGVCEPVLAADASGERDPGRPTYPYRLSTAGAAAVAQVLAAPRSELRELAEFLLSERAQTAVAPLLRRPPSGALTPAATHALLPGPLLHPATLVASEAQRLALRDSGPAEPAAQKPDSGPRPAAPASGVPWRLDGPLATIPATAAALSESMLSAAFMVSAETPSPAAPAHSRPPSSGPFSESGTRQEIDLGGLIQRAWAELHVARVRFALLGPTVYAIGERRALLQAWRELLRSAADAALQGEHSPPLVTVELDPSAEAVQILVHDSGPPLSQGDAAALDLSDHEPTPPSHETAAALRYTDSGKLHPAERARRGLWLAQRTLSQQGALLAVSTPQLGGNTVRVTLPRPLSTAA